MQIIKVGDESGSVALIWFNQPFLIYNFKKGVKISLSGELSWFGKLKAFISPEYEFISPAKKLIHTAGLIPTYPETKGISSKWLRTRIFNLLAFTENQITDYLPVNIKNENKLIELAKAYQMVHFPENESLAIDSKKRLGFDELLYFQIKNLINRKNWNKYKVNYCLKIDQAKIENFIKSLPFDLTVWQKAAIGEILEDLKKEIPMNRLLEGDVGSGKTVLAIIATLVSLLNHKQTIIMAPTQILANQHYKTFSELLHSFKVTISLITSGSDNSKNDDTDILIGTHALIHRKLFTKSVALIIIDEQHKFGVEQRRELAKTIKINTSPHLLTMTATPIPRTIVQTLYGNLDLSILKGSPANRKPVVTWLVPPQKRKSAYQWIQEKILSQKVQAFVVFPIIEESTKEKMLEVKSAKKELELLEKMLPKLKIGLLHGKLKPKEKNQVFADFKNRQIDMLVTTPVIEVGIDIPNATIMVIEEADRFGLAQLHQLRGRVGRSTLKSYCLLFTQNKSAKVTTRLSALQKTLSGFELAELDLKMRGPGEIFGLKQHGFPEIKIASWTDFDLIDSTKKAAIKIAANPKQFKAIKQALHLGKTID